MAGGMNPAFLAAIKAKSGGGGGQPGDSAGGTPPQFMNKGKAKGKAANGRQGAIQRRLAAMKK